MLASGQAHAIPLGQTENSLGWFECLHVGKLFSKKELGYFCSSVYYITGVLFIQRIFHVNKDICKLI